MKQILKYIYERLLDNMKFAEGKHAVTIALASAVIVFAINFLNLSTPFVATLSAGCIVFSLISILYSFIALSARKVKIGDYKGKEGIKYNLMYYKNIILFDEDTYISTIKTQYNLPKAYRPDEQDRDFARQIISVAKVTNLKFSYFNLSLLFLFLSLLCAVATILILGLNL